MNKKIRWITETAVMLALLVTLQALTKPMGQMVTGSCVNAILAVSMLVGGIGCGITVTLASPVLTVPAIIAGNAVYAVLLHLQMTKPLISALAEMGGFLVGRVDIIQNMHNNMHSHMRCMRTYIPEKKTKTDAVVKITQKMVGKHG